MPKKEKNSQSSKKQNNKNSQNKTKDKTIKRKSNKVALWGLFLIVLLSSITLLAIFYLKRPSEEVNLDPRSEAMIETGTVDLELYPFDQSTLKESERQEIKILVNSKDYGLSQVKSQLKITADPGILNKADLQITDVADDRLSISQENIAELSCGDNECFVINLDFSLTDSSLAYMTHNNDETIASLSFSPQKEGSLKIEVDESSQIIDAIENKDVLSIASNLDYEYFISENGIDPAQCYYEYSDWSSCEDGWQSRDFSVKPDNCHWLVNEEIADLYRQCSTTSSESVYANDSDFYVNSDASCWSGNNDGSDISIHWNKEKYPDVTWIDVSSSSDFSYLYHKQSSGYSENGILRSIDASNMTDASDGVGTMSFELAQTYFFRLYSSDGSHLQAKKFVQVYSCASSTSSSSTSYTATTRLSYLPSEYYDLDTYACNHGCNTNRDCDAGLRCYQGKCRSADDPTDAACMMGTLTEVEEITEIEDASNEAEIEAATASVSPEATITETKPIVKNTIDWQAVFVSIFSSFSWQWLALAGVIILIALASVVMGIAKSKKDPWAEVKSFEEEDKSKNPKANSEKAEVKKVIIPENKPLKIEKEK